MKEKKVWYPLSISQSTVNMQSLFTPHKEVLNLNVCLTPKENWDYETFVQAFNKEIEANDCLRLVFKPKLFTVKQRFLTELTVTPDILDFTGKTEKEQFAKLQELAEIPLKLKKGQSFLVHFVKTYDNRTMIYLTISHLCIDMFGLMSFADHLNKVYEAIKYGKDMPSNPMPYEDYVKIDSDYLKSTKCQKDAEYFKKYYASHKMTPNYVGVHGMDSEFWVNRRNKTKLGKTKTMKMFLVDNKCGSALLDFDDGVVADGIELCKTYKQTPSSLFYVCNAIALSYLNEEEESMLGLSLCNGRATAKESKTCGTRAQSVPVYTCFNKETTFVDLLTETTNQEKENLKHFRFPELKRESIMHKAYHTSMAITHYPFTYSFIPVMESDKYDFQMISSNRFVLPAYLALFYDVNKNTMKATYLYQLKLTTDESIRKYHKTVEKIISIIAKNPNTTIGQIFGTLKGIN